jgi:hypothetical protein
MNTIPNHGELEQKIGLLLHIGRDIAKRGEAGFNVNVELSGNHIAAYPFASEGRYKAFEFLERVGLIEVGQISYLDRTPTFVECRLTNKGRTLYEKVEREYGSFIYSFIDSFG